MATNGFDDDQTRSITNLAAGTLVSHYKIISRIGAGGMGEVYQAWDTELDRKVALKFLSPHLCQDDDCCLRFKREARAVAKLNHPNIITIHEVSEYQGRLFFAMQLVEGESLGNVISEDKLPLDRILDLAIHICEGLQEAHDAGVVHRDIKPSNILVDDRGRVRIVDFGLAKGTGQSDLTQSGSTLGTISYMSPEQVQNTELIPASDLFSLGVIMYEMLTGKRPFTGEFEASVIYAIVNATPEPVTKLKPDVPRYLENVVSRLLEKDVRRRYQNAAEVLADLQKGTIGAVDQDRPTRTTWRTGTRAVRAFWLLPVAICLVLAWRLLLFTPQDSVSDRKMLAVLPFENLGGSEDEYFADGMTDAITMRL